MKSSLLIVTIALLISSCATSNYGKIKYSRAITTKVKDADTKQTVENTMRTNELKVDELDKEQKNISFQETLTIERKEKKKNYTTLHKKLNNIQRDQREVISTIHLNEKETSKERPKKNTAKLERLAYIYGWLSLIPLPLIGWTFSFLAIITGAIVINRIKNNPNSLKKYSKKAATAVGLGILTLVVWGIIILLMMASW